MNTNSRRLTALVITFLAAQWAGCTADFNRWSFVEQAESLEDVYEQQVLDNLAKFVVNPHALPHFAVPYDGTNSTTDTGNLSSGAFNTFRMNIGGSLNRRQQDQWGLKPIVDPDRLTRMRCAYQRAIGCPSVCCIDCCELEQAWQGQIPTKVKVLNRQTFEPILDPKTGQPYDINCPDGSPLFIDGRPTEHALNSCIDEDGYVTIPGYDCNGPCAVQCGWLEVGCLTDLPRGFTGKIGRSGTTVVWVKPGYEDHFTRLVLKILDYAVNDAPVVASRQKEVSYLIDAAGDIVTSPEQAVGVVTEVINANELPTSIIEVDRVKEAELLKKRRQAALSELSKALQKEKSIVSQLSKFDDRFKPFAQMDSIPEDGVTNLLKSVELKGVTKQRAIELEEEFREAAEKAKQAREQLNNVTPARDYPDVSPLVFPKSPSQDGFGRNRRFGGGQSPLDLQRQLRAISPGLTDPLD